MNVTRFQTGKSPVRRRCGFAFAARLCDLCRMSAPLPRLQRIGAWLLAGLMLLAMALLWQPRAMTRQGGAGTLRPVVSTSGATTLPEATLRPVQLVRQAAPPGPDRAPGPVPPLLVATTLALTPAPARRAAALTAWPRPAYPVGAALGPRAPPPAGA